MAYERRQRSCGERFDLDFSAEYLKKYSTTRMRGGGKALKVTFKGFNADWTGQKNATIDLGGKYKVSEIESVVIRYKIVAGNANVW